MASGDRFSFDALQMRLHPAATPIRRLSEETPAVLTCFDLLLSPDGRDLRAEPLQERRRLLEALIEALAEPTLTVTPGTADRPLATSWRERGTTPSAASWKATWKRR